MSILTKSTKRIYLETVTVADAELILKIRLDPKKNQFLSKINNSLEEQQQWLNSYKQREALKQEFYFKIILDKSYSEKNFLTQTCVGLCRAYDLKDDSFGWGSWIITPDAPNFVAIESYLTISEFGFYTLNLPNTHFEVLKSNEKVISFHQRMGAVRKFESSDKIHFTLSRSTYENGPRKKYYKYFIEKIISDIE